MNYHSNLITGLLLLIFGTSAVYGNTGLDTLSLPKSYQGTASFKASGIYHASISELGIDGTSYEYKETIEENGKVNALLMGNFLIYMPAIDNPIVTGTVTYHHHTYRDGKPLTADTAPAQNITSYLQGSIGLYLDYRKKTYTLSMGLGAEGSSTRFATTDGQVESQTKKRFELEKVELTLPLPNDLQVLKGSKTITILAKTPNALHKVMENKKTIEIAWEFTASSEKNVLPKQTP